MDLAALRDRARAEAVHRPPEAPDGLPAIGVRAAFIAGVVAALIVSFGGTALGVGLAGWAGLGLCLTGIASWIAAVVTVRFGIGADGERDGQVAGALAAVVAASIAAPAPLVGPHALRGARHAEERLDAIAWMVGSGSLGVVAVLVVAGLWGRALGRAAGARTAREVHPELYEDPVGSWHAVVAAATAVPVPAAVAVGSAAVVYTASSDIQSWLVRLGPTVGTGGALGLIALVGLPWMCVYLAARTFGGGLRGATAFRDGSDRAGRQLFWMLLTLSPLGAALLFGGAVAELDRVRVGGAGWPWGTTAAFAVVVVGVACVGALRSAEIVPTTIDAPRGALSDGALLGGIAVQVSIGGAAMTWLGVHHVFRTTPMAPDLVLTWVVAAFAIGLPWLSWAWWASFIDAFAAWWRASRAGN